MMVDTSLLIEFATKMQDAYEERTMLPDLCNLRDYKKKDKNLEYVQFGKRTGIPTKIFEQGVISPTTNKFVRSIVNGEKKFLLTELVNSAKDERFGYKQINQQLSIDDIADAAKNINGADTLFLPITEEYNDVINDWVSDGILSIEGQGHIKVNGYELQVERVPSNYGISDVIVADRSNISMVQKRFEDSNPPKGMDFDSSLVSVNTGERMMVYFGKETEAGHPNEEYDEFLETLYRVVVSQPIVDSNGVFVLKSP